MDTGREEYLLSKRFMRATEVLMPVLPFAVGGTVQCSEFLLSVHRHRALQHHK